MFSTASVFDRLGSSGLFLLMAGLFVALLPFLALLPRKWPTATAAGSRESQRPPRIMARLPVAPSFVPFIVVQAGVYTFLGEFGRIAANLSVDATLHVIGISVVLSSLGSVAAYWLNDRIGLRSPIGGAIVVMSGMLFGMVLGSRSAALFLSYISSAANWLDLSELLSLLGTHRCQ